MKSIGHGYASIGENYIWKDGVRELTGTLYCDTTGCGCCSMDEPVTAELIDDIIETNRKEFEEDN